MEAAIFEAELIQNREAIKFLRDALEVVVWMQPRFFG